MATAVSRTFRVFVETSKFIDSFSEQNGLTYSESLQKMAEITQKLMVKRRFQKELDELASDRMAMKESVEWADLKLVDDHDW